MLKKRGQSTLEYVIVLTAIVSAIIAAAALLGQRNTNAGAGQLFNSAAQRVTDASGRLLQATQ